MNPLQIICCEGSRGTGKSTLTRLLRQAMKDTTLINFTGFNTDGEEGLKKVADYYSNWMNLLHNMKSDNHEQTIICDRIFFSEMVYSKLYKNYDFSHFYRIFVDSLKSLNPTIFFFTINDEEELSQRLQRDKVPFHNVEESVKETLKQQEEYTELFKGLQDVFNIVTIDTTYLTTEQVKEIVLSEIQKK